MGNCEGLEILGVLKTAQEGKEMVLQLKPSIETPGWEPCGFCDFKLDSDRPIDKLQSSKETEHSHAIQGVFSFIPSKNQWTLTFSNCDKEKEKHENVGKPTSTCEIVKNDITINRQKNLQIQYEVDGKVFELRSTFSQKKSRNVESSNNNFVPPTTTIAQPTKAIEFVIENKKYSTSSANTKPFEETIDVGEERSALEASLELLQFYSCTNQFYCTF